MSDNGPPPWLKIIPDDAPVTSRGDTLNMGDAWRALAKRDAAPGAAEKGPTPSSDSTSEA